MSLEIVKPEHHVNLTRAEVKRIIHQYVENQLSRDVRVISFSVMPNVLDNEVMVTAYLKSE